MATNPNDFKHDELVELASELGADFNESDVKADIASAIDEVLLELEPEEAEEVLDEALETPEEEDEPEVPGPASAPGFPPKPEGWDKNWLLISDNSGQAIGWRSDR